MNLLHTIIRSSRPALLSVVALVLFTGSTGLAGEQKAKPNLYMVSVGISKYAGLFKDEPTASASL